MYHCHLKAPIAFTPVYFSGKLWLEGSIVGGGCVVCTLQLLCMCVFGGWCGFCVDCHLSSECENQLRALLPMECCMSPHTFHVVFSAP